MTVPVENSELALKQAPVEKTVQPAEPIGNSFDYSDVFTAAEWKELQNMSEAERSTWTQQLARRGISRLGELTGVMVRLPNKEKQQNVFAFSVGNFEVRHVSAK